MHVLGCSLFSWGALQDVQAFMTAFALGLREKTTEGAASHIQDILMRSDEMLMPWGSIVIQGVKYNERLGGAQTSVSAKTAVWPSLMGRSCGVWCWDALDMP